MTSVNKPLKINTISLLIYSFFNLFVIFRIDLLMVPGYLYLLATLGILFAFIEFRLNSDKDMPYTLIIYFLLLIIAGISLILNSSNDLSYFNRLISVGYKFGLGAFSVYIFTIVFKRLATFDNFILSFTISCLLLLITSLILILFSGFSNFWIGTIVSRNKLLDEGYFFRKSIIGYTGFDEVSIYCVSYFCCAKMIADKMNARKRTLKLWILYIVLILGGLIYGRVSAVSAFLSIFGMFLCVKNKKRLFAKFLVFIFIIVCGFFLLYFVSLNNESVSSWFNWAFEPILAFFTKSDVGSLNSLKRMVKLPNLKQFIFGDGMFITSTGYYMSTDIGYLRDIYYFGVLGLICIYLFILLFLKSIFKKQNHKSNYIFLAFLFLNIIVLEMKGCMWDGSIIYLSMLYFIAKYEKAKKYRIKNNLKKVKYEVNMVVQC